MTKKEKRLAIGTALQNCAEVMTIVDDLDNFESPKTNKILSILLKLGADPMKEKVLFLSSALKTEFYLSGRNIEMLTFSSLFSLNIFDLLNADKIIIDKGALSAINDLYGVH